MLLAVCPTAARTGFFGEEALARMPPVARRTILTPEAVVETTMRALAAGQHGMTVPGRLAMAYLVNAIAPGFVRRNVKRARAMRLRRRTRAARSAAAMSDFASRSFWLGASRTFPSDVFDTARARSLGFGGMHGMGGSVVACAGAVE